MISSRLPRLLLAALLVSGLLATSGCFVRPGYGTVYVNGGYTASGAIVYQQPPQARVVVRPMAPQAGYVWVDGYWNWNGAQWMWADGYWTAPRVGYQFVQPRWEQRGRGYVYVQGGWRGGGGGGRVVVQPGRPQPRPQPRGRGGVVEVRPGGESHGGDGRGTVEVR